MRLMFDAEGAVLVEYGLLAILIVYLAVVRLIGNITASLLKISGSV
jgi:Flp pilus assembly pilin Flp